MVEFIPSVSGANKAVVIRKGMDGAPTFRLELAPAEAEKATYLISIAAGMPKSLEILPDHIANTPFVIRLFVKPAHTAALERSDQGGSIPFRRFEDSDALILAIRTAVDMAVNAQRHSGAARAGATAVVGGYLATDEVV